MNGVVYGREFRFVFSQKTCSAVISACLSHLQYPILTSTLPIDYVADVVEDVFFNTLARQSMSVTRSNWSLLEAGLSRAFAFHIAVVTGAPTIVVLVALVYLDRMRCRLVISPACLTHGLVPERLLLGAWILAFQVRSFCSGTNFLSALTVSSIELIRCSS